MSAQVQTLQQNIRPKKTLKTQLPDYTRAEEVMNMASHALGAVFAAAAIAVMTVVSAKKGNAWGVVSGAIYGTTLLIMFTVSSVYHGLPRGNAKKVMRVIDHCDIYFLIAGTYTPILLCGIREANPAIAWTIFGVEWGLAALAVTLNAIDLKKFEKVSMACYIGMGWCIVAVVKACIDAMTWQGFLLLLYGGVAFTIGAALYGIGKKVRYMHSVFHIFVLIGCVLQFLSILFYIL